MRGQRQVVVRNNRVQFTLTIRRNITILLGDSATGKTTLIDMIAAYQLDGVDSGVTVRCESPCVVLNAPDWQTQLAGYENSVVFIDEGARYVTSEDFARAIKGSSNYYVIANRQSLQQLPYSVEEIYGIRNNTRSRTNNIWRYYSSNRRLYGIDYLGPGYLPDEVIVEDSNAGFQFFSALCKKLGIPCRSAEGKTKIYRAVCRSSAKDILLIADGAAFGSEYDRIKLYSDMNAKKRVRLFLPESFEHLLLSSGLIRDDELPSILSDPPAFIESKDYFSWERFFTALITSATSNTYLQYAKGRLNSSYLQSHEMQAIEQEMAREGLQLPSKP